jgi:maleylacetate reductase
MTPIFGLTEAGVKRTGTDLKVLPRTVIYDPELTMTLSAEMSVASGMNALAHAAEGLYAQDANPITSLMSEEAIGALARGLRGVTRDANDIGARTDALYGAWLAGTVLGAVGMALHHKLCHTLGGSFNLPHAQTHAVMLPHVLAYNAKAAPDAMARVARALGVPHAARGVYDLARENGSPVSLRDIGMREIELDRAAELATTNAYWNPRRIDLNSVRGLLQMAFEGRPPEELTSRQRLT